MLSLPLIPLKAVLTSLEAGESAARGIKKVYPNATTIIRPLADGGEGTAYALANGCGGRLTNCYRHRTSWQNRLSCQYGIVDETHTAIIEMAGAAGITLVSPQRSEIRLNTTTYGVGEVIAGRNQK